MAHRSPFPSVSSLSLQLRAALAGGAARALLCTSASQHVFNVAQKAAQRRAAASRRDAADFDYLRDEVATRLVDRLHDITRSFPDALDLGANTCNVAKQLEETGAGGVERLYVMEPCRECAWGDIK